MGSTELKIEFEQFMKSNKDSSDVRILKWERLYSSYIFHNLKYR